MSIATFATDAAIRNAEMKKKLRCLSMAKVALNIWNSNDLCGLALQRALHPPNATAGCNSEILGWQCCVAGV